MLNRFDAEQTLSFYQRRLALLGNRHLVGQHGLVAAEAMSCLEDLDALVLEIPTAMHGELNYLVGRFEALRASCAMMTEHGRKPSVKSRQRPA